MAFRTKTAGAIKLDAIGDSVELDVSDLADLRGQLDLDNGAVGACRVAFEFALASSGGDWYEPDTATRLDAEEISAIIDCRGYARARLRVVVVSAIAGSLGRLTLSAYAPHCG